MQNNLNKTPLDYLPAEYRSKISASPNSRSWVATTSNSQEEGIEASR